MSLMRERNGPRYKHVGDESAPFDTITIDKLTPIIGAEVGGVDLARPLGNQTIDEAITFMGDSDAAFCGQRDRQPNQLRQLLPRWSGYNASWFDQTAAVAASTTR